MTQDEIIKFLTGRLEHVENMLQLSMELNKKLMSSVPSIFSSASPRGCQVCGRGANGESDGYVCARNDCPSITRNI